MSWHLDPEQFQHALLDLIGLQEPRLRRELLESIVRYPGESIAMRQIRRDVAEVSVLDTSGVWHVVGTLDIGQLETAGPPDWN